MSGPPFAIVAVYVRVWPFTTGFGELASAADTSATACVATWHGENSDVFPFGSVAVRVIAWPAGMSATSSTFLNARTPCAFVLAGENEPRNPAPSPLPDGSQVGLA